ncbi:MAG TPA: acyloxyacyl hydrolase [Syntrophales bacterium]|nr:acyloxyacyl hydrolase [Syntrophales bacterium]HOL60055.1 acyloxyacyl hydrolase [Syntrophales bacterium]HPO36165.1 acyloxyacyl hydrolase [Syntrophales bacterium]
MKRKAIVLIIPLLIAFVVPFPTGAGERPEKGCEIGIVSGVGTGHSTAGNYHPILLATRLAWDIRKVLPQLAIWNGNLSFIFEPQVNPAFSPHTDVELGLGLGLRYIYKWSERLAPYLLGTFGPHFITLQDEDQKNGFLFSTAFEAGLCFYLDNSSFFQLGYRFRHLSNGGLWEPNGGLNSHFLTIGYTWLF